jgi:hypothetical protein
VSQDEKLWEEMCDWLLHEDSVIAAEFREEFGARVELPALIRELTTPRPCFPDQNLANVEEAARDAGPKGEVYIANEAIEDMAREIREWRALARTGGKP